MKYSFKIGSILGIPIELHLTFLILIIAFFVIFYPNFYYPVLTIFLFVFVFFHELAHSIVAKHYSIKVRKIVLYPIGGVSEIEEISENPSIEWRLALSGPLTSLALGAALFAASQLVTLQSTTIISPYLSLVERFLFDLASLNVLLGFFNLIPALPMDGGRVFRALLSKKINYSDATKYSVYVGKIFGVVFVIVGFIWNFWLVLIGIFVYLGASEESEQTIATANMAKIRVSDVMQPKVGIINSEQNIAEAQQVMFQLRYNDVIVEKEQQFQGILTWSEVMKVSAEQRIYIKVEESPLRRISVFDDGPVTEASKIMNQENIDLLPVLKKEEPTKIAGVLTKAGIANAWEKAKKLK